MMMTAIHTNDDDWCTLNDHADCCTLFMMMITAAHTQWWWCADDDVCCTHTKDDDCRTQEWWWLTHTLNEHADCCTLFMRMMTAAHTRVHSCDHNCRAPAHTYLNKFLISTILVSLSTHAPFYPHAQTYHYLLTYLLLIQALTHSFILFSEKKTYLCCGLHDHDHRRAATHAFESISFWAQPSRLLCDRDRYAANQSGNQVGRGWSWFGAAVTGASMRLIKVAIESASVEIGAGAEAFASAVTFASTAAFASVDSEGCLFGFLGEKEDALLVN